MSKEPVLETYFTYKDYKCCVLFQALGHRCGYVLVPYWHSQYEKDYEPDRESQMRYFGDNDQDNFFNMLNFMSGNDTGFGTVKNLDFCIEECKNIVDQLREMEQYD